MLNLTPEFIKKNIAYSEVIFQKGTMLYEHGGYLCSEADLQKGSFLYEIDGNYGDYTTRIQLLSDGLNSSCDCPYPGKGCKHTVAALLDIQNRLIGWKQSTPETLEKPIHPDVEPEEPYLTEDEIRLQAVEDRKKRARNEEFKVIEGDMYKGEHLLQTPRGRQYEVTLHDPSAFRGHCSCPDFETSRLGICKHIYFLSNYFKRKDDFETRLSQERFPFLDVYWDSVNDRPRLFCERPESEMEEIRPFLSEYFDEQGTFIKNSLSDLFPLILQLRGNKRFRIQDAVLNRLDVFMLDQQLFEMSADPFPSLSAIKTRLYPYQEEGVKYALYKKAALIGDEMGLGKTLQAIALGLLKKEIFGFQKVLVVTLASLKEQWKREIERFSDEAVSVIAGNPMQRRKTYELDRSLFKITNYEAVLRDTTIISHFKPDLVILDEAQRIKNFNTKTADAVKNIPRKHALVLTGTPLENKLEDVYSIIQFLDPYMLSPLWKFAADHFMISRHKKGKILGYRNLDKLHERLKSIVIRRRKEEVLSDLPDEIVNNYYLELTEKQLKIHNGYLQSLLPLLNKKFLTPMDIRRMQELLLRMRMVCNSTYLIDRKTNISPKLKELEGILDELVLQNKRKVVIFSEWTTMTFLIARQLSNAGIKFVELSGKIPVKKRQALIDEFTHNPECKVFLSTDAGGTGLNLQAADCVVNFELPWNPARMNQRIGRVNRIGQKSRSINVVNLISKDSIEEKILAGIQLKTDLFKGVFDGDIDMVEFSREKRTEMLNRLREMMGEEPVAPVHESSSSEDIPDDTPHYLNPQVLGKEDGQLNYHAEETENEPVAVDLEATSEGKAPDSTSGNILAGKPPEKIERVLNSGMQFISGLMEMATGKKLETTEADNQMIHIDRDTGEVTMKFRLPAF